MENMRSKRLHDAIVSYEYNGGEVRRDALGNVEFGVILTGRLSEVECWRRERWLETAQRAVDDGAENKSERRQYVFVVAEGSEKLEKNSRLRSAKPERRSPR